MNKPLLGLAAASVATAAATITVSVVRTGTFVMDRVEVPGGREVPSAYFPVAAVALLIAIAAAGAALATGHRAR